MSQTVTSSLHDNVEIILAKCFPCSIIKKPEAKPNQQSISELYKVCRMKWKASFQRFLLTWIQHTLYTPLPQIHNAASTKHNHSFITVPTFSAESFSNVVILGKTPWKYPFLLKFHTSFYSCKTTKEEWMSTAGEREIITKIKFPSQECPPNAKIIEKI